jgi:hypothetical protein
MLLTCPHMMADIVFNQSLSIAYVAIYCTFPHTIVYIAT